jgi:hypothetical protein
MKPTEREIQRCLLTLASGRGTDKTFCPSEAARQLAPDTWRELMPQVRAEAIALVKTGKLRCTQGGEEVDPTNARGPLRFSVRSRG